MDFTLMNHHSGPTKPSLPKIEELKNLIPQYHNRLETSCEISIDSLETLKTNCSNSEELLASLLKSILYCSLYATYQEVFLVGALDYFQEIDRYVQAYDKSRGLREEEVSKQQIQHIYYILGGGKCEGCFCCENHYDVKELIVPWENRDLSLFSSLYVGTNSIFFFMENFIFDGVEKLDIFPNMITKEKLLALRRDIFEYSQKNIYSEN